MCVFCLHVCVCIVYAWCLLRLGESIGCPGTGVGVGVSYCVGMKPMWSARAPSALDC